MDQPSSQQNLPLDYYNTTANRVVFPAASKVISYRIAFACWLVPLVLGLCNFFLWCLLGFQILRELGTVIIVCGFAAGAFTLVFGAYFLICRLRAGARVWQDSLAPVIGLIALLFLSLLLTIACSAVAYRH